jgi:hypothetical protein
VPAILASAAAPLAGAGLLATGGTQLVYATCLGMALAGFAAGAWIVRRLRD